MLVRSYEDAIVDHAGEGMYGEIFFAAMQSAAFVESDKRKLLAIGLSYIPEESKMAQAIRMAIDCYDKGVSFKEARKSIHNVAPGTFGIQPIRLCEIIKEGNEGLEIGEPGFDAPENVAFTVAAWLYGEDDFGKSLCLAVACGEDTDCTAATLGALMGIVLGAKQLPEKWVAPLDDKIATLCIDKTSRGIWVPETVEELTGRVIRTMPLFMGQELCDIYTEDGIIIDCLEGDALYCEKEDNRLYQINGNGVNQERTVHSLSGMSPYIVRYAYPAFNVEIDYNGTVFFKQGEPHTIKVSVQNSYTMRQQQWVKISLYTPIGVEVIGGKQIELPLNNNVGCRAEAAFTFNADQLEGSKLEMIIDVSLVGRHSSGAMKVTMMRGK